MATAATKITEFVFEWEGRDRNGKQVRGETRAAGENQVQAALRRQGVSPTKVRKRRMRAGAKIKPKDIEGRRAAVAGIRHCRPRQRQRQRHQTAQ
jgi:type IV pilus assembly protein PilC